jgi:Tfp pilus assembly protein PilF
MTREIKGMITMKKSNLLTITGATLALALAGCATSGGSKTAREPLPDEDGGKNGGGAAVTERETISKAGAEQIIPKEKKRNITADARADFEKAMKRYESAKKGDGISGSECSSVADAFKRVADDNPGLVEARYNQGAVLYECGRADDAARIWEGMKYGPALTNLGYIAWKNNEPGRAESLFNQAIKDDPLHSVEARNNVAQILRDRAHKADPSNRKQYVADAVSNLRTVLALDSNNLQAFSTLAFIYYDMNMLEMAKLVGNQAIKKAEEIATGKFEEEKVEEANEKAAVKGGKGKKKDKGEKKAGGGGDDDEAGKAKEIGREAGTGVTSDMKKQLAVVHNTLGLVELKKKNISPAIKQFKEAATLNPNFAEARMNLAALSLNNRDYLTAEENFRAVIKLQPKNFEASIGLGVALRGNKKIEEAEAQYNSARSLDPSQGASYFNLGLLYQEYKDGQKPSLQKAQDFYKQFLGHASGSTSESLKKEAEKRIKDIDEIYVALAEAEKMQRESEEMQKKAEAQQKQMEEEMKKQEAAEKAAADKAAADKAGGDAKKAGGDAKGAGDKAAPASGGDKGADDAAGKTEGAADDKGAAPADKPAKKGGKKKK